MADRSPHLPLRPKAQKRTANKLECTQMGQVVKEREVIVREFSVEGNFQRPHLLHASRGYGETNHGLKARMSAISLSFWFALLAESSCYCLEDGSESGGTPLYVFIFHQHAARITAFSIYGSDEDLMRTRCGAC
jgi:hypothetical protein